VSLAQFGITLNIGIGIALKAGIRDIPSLTAWWPLRY
jgi:hypothetical protein